MKKIEALLKQFGQKYSEQLGIKLNEKGIFKWFLASILFGAPITESSAVKTYKTFEKYKVLTPEKILETSWDGLVQILDEGSYTRYDFKTADKLLLVMSNLQKKYNGSLSNLYSSSKNEDELKTNLKSLGKGIGDVTVNIFLRELRYTWNVNPEPQKFAVIAARDLKFTKSKDPKKVLKDLKKVWSKNKVKGKDFINFECALLRIGKKYCTKNKSACPMREWCFNS